MRLESIDEIRAQGVTVYPHVVEKAQPLDVSRFNVPDWARWVAADSYGNVFSYSRRPSNDDGTAWVIQGYTYSMFIATINMVGIDWRSTLTAVNVEQPQPWCERCNLPEDICRGHDAPAQCDRGNAALVAVEAAGSVLKGFFGGGPSDVGQQVVAAPSLPVETIVALWQQLDGMQECDLAAAMVRAEARRADGFFTTLGMALDAVQSPQYNSDYASLPFWIGAVVVTLIIFLGNKK